MKTTIELKYKILSYLIIFIALVLGLIYLFQVVFLQEFYTNNKINSLKQVANNVILNLEREDLGNYIYDQAIKNDVCIRVLSDKDYNSNNAIGCSLAQLNTQDLLNLAVLAKENGGSYLHETSSSFMVQAEFNIMRPSIIKSLNRSFTYVRYLNSYNQRFLVLVNTMVTPVNATVETLKNQFFYVCVIVIIAVIILALIIAKSICKPLQIITDAANDLSSSNYDPKNLKTSYKEIVRLNKTLTEANERIHAADKAKRDLIANVSHDLRTPLTMIQGYGEMMRDLPGENNAENAQVIIDEASRLSYLVNDLLDLSAIENNLELNLEKIHVKKLLNDIYKQYEGYCAKENFVFEFEMEKDCLVTCDVKRIKQVVYNFLNNAINYSSKEKYIKLKQSIIDNECLIEVIDHGDGIEESKISMIWDRYYKVDKEHKRSYIGSGIGLNIASNILKLHNAEYGCKSKLNEGSIFYFKLKITNEKK